MGLYFGVICLQETWLASDADLSLLQLPGYNVIHQDSKCTKHGGLIIYQSEMYSFKLRNLCQNSDIWEGLFIDVMGLNLRKPLTICNTYRPPDDNNSNDKIFVGNITRSQYFTKGKLLRGSGRRLQYKLVTNKWTWKIWRFLWPDVHQ